MKKFYLDIGFSGPWLVMSCCFLVVLITRFSAWTVAGAVALMWLSVAGEALRWRRLRAEREAGRIPLFGPLWFAGLAAALTIFFTRLDPTVGGIMAVLCIVCWSLEIVRWIRTGRRGADALPSGGTDDTPGKRTDAGPSGGASAGPNDPD